MVVALGAARAAVRAVGGLVLARRAGAADAGAAAAAAGVLLALRAVVVAGLAAGLAELGGEGAATLEHGYTASGLVN